MLDINFILEQESLSRKSSLLKNIKLTLESLLFDRSNSNASYNSLWHNFNGNVNRFCRCIFEILSDGLILENLELARRPTTSSHPDQSNQIFNMSSSFSATSHSASSPQAFEDYSSSSRSNFSTSLSSTRSLWSFLFFLFTEELANQNRPYSGSAGGDGLAQFRVILEQLDTNKRFMSLNSYDQSLQHEFPGVNQTAMDWIFYSLRQRMLLEQLRFLNENRHNLQRFYIHGAFLMDASFCADFLIYVQAFEQDNYAILNQVKNVCVSYLIEEQHKRSSNRSSRLDLTVDTTNIAEPPGPPTNMKLLASAQEKVRQHRRIHSFPNIQINLLKKSSTENKEKESSQTGPNDKSNAGILMSRNAIILENSDVGVSTAELTNDKDETLTINELKRPTEVPKIELNSNPIDFEENENSFSQSSTNESAAFFEEQLKLFQSINIFDFIHSVQMNCESNQLDKENAHFVLADLAIASAELIKTEHMLLAPYEQSSLFPPHLLQFLDSTASSQALLLSSSNRQHSRLAAKRISSASIKINNQSISSSIIRSFDDNTSTTATSFIANQDTPDFTSATLLNSFSQQTSREASSPANSATPPVTLRKNNERLVRNSFSMSNLNALVFGAGHSAAAARNNNRLDNIKDILVASRRQKFEKSRSSIDTLVLATENNHKLQLRALHNTNSQDSSEDGSEFKRKQWLNTNKSVNTQINNSFLFELSTESAKSGSRQAANLSLSASFSFNQDESTTNTKNNHILMSQSLSQFRDESPNQTEFPSVNSTNTRNWSKNQSTNLSSSFTPKSPMINEDGFEIVLNKEKAVNRVLQKAFTECPLITSTESDLKQQQNRVRKFSWEETDDMDTAEYIADRLIYNLLIRLNQSQNFDSAQLPSLEEFEFFIRNLQYSEFIQNYHESIDHARLKKITANLLVANAGTSISVPMSSTSIYLSHASTTQLNAVKNMSGVSGLMLKAKNDVRLESNSTWYKVRQAALAAIETKKSKNAASSDSCPVTVFKAAANKSRIIGDNLWAPVREQLILNTTPKQKRQILIQQQQFRCADCGIQISQNKIKTFNYCEYFCKYFCRCCHTSNKSYIPAQIINFLDFRTTFEVSKKAKNFLEKIYNEPLITLESLNPQLFQDKMNVFSRIKKLRFKLVNSRSYVNSCRFAKELKTRMYNDYDDFIINDQHVYSIETLFKIKKTNFYYERMNDMVNSVVIHIKTCELCSQQGYICGFCTRNDLLYPFELEKVEKCPNCLACYHRMCFRTPEECPRCLRKQNRVKSNPSSPGTSNDMMVHTK